MVSNSNLLFQGSIFRGENVSFREGMKLAQHSIFPWSPGTFSWKWPYTLYEKSPKTFFGLEKCWKWTPPKTNISPEKAGWKTIFLLKWYLFKVTCYFSGGYHTVFFPFGDEKERKIWHFTWWSRNLFAGIGHHGTSHVVFVATVWKT